MREVLRRAELERAEGLGWPTQLIELERLLIQTQEAGGRTVARIDVARLQLRGVVRADRDPGVD